MPENNKKWAVVGYYGGSNLGDDAMLDTLLASIPPKETSRLLVFGKTALIQKTVESAGAKFAVANIKNLMQEIFNLEGLILVGGTFYHDEYSKSKKFSYLIKLFRYTLLTVLFWAQNKPVIMIGVGIGPINKFATKFLASLSLNIAKVIVVRDADSYACASKFCSTNKIILSSDLIFLSGGKYINTRHHQNNILGISPVTLTHFNKSMGRNSNLFWKDLAVELKKHLISNPNLRLRLFAFWTSPEHAENDTFICSEIMNELGNDFADKIDLIEYDNNPKSFIKYIGECDSFIATRYHAVLISFLMNCRVLAITYNLKVQSALNEILEPDQMHELYPYSPDSIFNLKEELNFLINGTTKNSNAEKIKHLNELSKANIKALETYVFK